MDDSQITISITAHDDFSPAFQQVLESLDQSQDAADRAAQGFSGVQSAASQAGQGVTGLQLALDAANAAQQERLDLMGQSVDLQQLELDQAEALAELAAQRSAQEQAVLIAQQGQVESLRQQQELASKGASFLEGTLLPATARRGLAGWQQGPGISALLGQGGASLDEVASNMSTFTGGLTEGFTGGMLAGGVGAALAVLMQNPEMQQLMGQLNAVLQELVTPIADALAPSLEALAPVLVELKPVFVLIGETLRLTLSPLVLQLNLLSSGIDALKSWLEPLGSHLADLQGALESLGDGFLQPLEHALDGVQSIGGNLVRPLQQVQEALQTLGSDFLAPVQGALQGLQSALNTLADALSSGLGLGGGGGGGGLLGGIGGLLGGVGSSLGFADGGMVTAQRMLTPPGADGGGLIYAHVGERVTPAGASAAGHTFNFQIQASDPHASAQQIRQVIEELVLTRRLGLNS